jgi:hypothetical protein
MPEERADHPSSFDQWALVEVMGHRRYAGRVTEASLGGQSFVRVDVPPVELETAGQTIQAFTVYLGGHSIFALTPVTEETARTWAKEWKMRPIPAWDIKQAMAELATDRQPRRLTHDEEFDEDDHDEYPG